MSEEAKQFATLQYRNMIHTVAGEVLKVEAEKDKQRKKETIPHGKPKGRCIPQKCSKSINTIF